jgi:hypothetical protein
MNFKEFLTNCENPKQKYSTIEVANMYFGNKLPIKKILEETGLCRKELYHIVRSIGIPNRLKINHHNVIALADQDIPLHQVANMTHYSPQNVKYILNRRLKND